MVSPSPLPGYFPSSLLTLAWLKSAKQSARLLLRCWACHRYASPDGIPNAARRFRLRRRANSPSASKSKNQNTTRETTLKFVVIA